MSDHPTAPEPRRVVVTGIGMVTPLAVGREQSWSALLAGENVAFDVAGHREAPPGLRIWAGATVDREDLEALMPWLDWAYAEVKAAFSRAT